jgi:hypothetical protein
LIVTSNPEPYKSNDEQKAARQKEKDGYFLRQATIIKDASREGAD